MPEDWSHYQKLVIQQLQDLNSSVGDIKETIASHHTAIEVLKVRSTLYGAVGGLAGGILTVLGTFLANWLKHS